MTNKTYNIEGMSCAACSARVQSSVEKLDGVSECSVNLLKNSMSLSFDESKLSDYEIINAVEKAGYKAKLKPKTNAKAANEKLHKKADKILLRLLVSLGLLMVLMVISMGHMFGLNIIPHEKQILKGIIELAISVPIILLNIRYFLSGFKALIRLNPNMDSLIAIGSATSVIYSIYLIFAGGAAHYYFESASMILTFVTIGKYLESKSKAKTTEAVEKLMNLTPKTSLVLIDGVETEILSEDIEIGQTVVVKSGMTFPADGIVTFGEGMVNESAITGESLPVDKIQGAQVIGGTQLLSGYVRFEAKKVGEETTLAGIIRLVDQATETKPKIARFADKISKIFVPTVILLAVVTTLIWLLFTGDVALSLNFGITILVISCPCALGLATPTAIMVGTGKAAQLGILVKSAEIFEVGEKVLTVMFDKTGTITTGKPEVTHFVIADGFIREEILSSAKSIELMSDHPLAKAIVTFCKDVTSQKVDKYQYTSSKGIEAVIEKDTYHIGNLYYISKYSDENYTLIEQGVSLSEKGKTALYMSKNDKLCCIFGISDKLKDSSVEAVKMLKDSNISAVMLTGDNKLTSKEICKSAGIDNFRAELMPQDKNEIIKEYQASHPVAMVGDGINDSPALAVADVGIAVGSGTDIAMEAADVVLIRDDMRDVHTVLKLCKYVMRIIRQNLFWALIYNCICIPIAAGVFYPAWGFQLPPMLGTVAMSLSSICVVSNALRIKRFKRDYKIKEEIIMKTIYIDGMMCPHCQNRVRELLSALDPTADVNLEKKCATVNADVNDEKIIEVINGAGYKVVNIK